MELAMVKIILILVATAVPAFGAGMWAEAALVEHQRTETSAVSTLSTISPSEMHLKMKPQDLPVQYMQGDYN
jgi:hypothetical protein